MKKLFIRLCIRLLKKLCNDKTTSYAWLSSIWIEDIIVNTWEYYSEFKLLPKEFAVIIKL